MIIVCFCLLADVNAIPVPSNTISKDTAQKIITSSFSESIVVASDSIFGNSNSSKVNVPVVKKRKLESNKSINNTTDEMIRYSNYLIYV